MATIGKLVVTLSANTAKFRTGLAKAAATAKKFGAAIGKAGLKVAAIGAAAATAAITGIAILTKRAAEQIDALGKLASRLGDTTEAIAGLRFAAELTGAGTATLDKSLEQLTRRLGEAKTGTGEAKDALDDLGLSSVDLANKAPSKAFVEIAEAINLLPTAADKAQAAYSLFGRAGVKLINTLSEGADGLAAMAKEAELFGKAITTVEAKQIENANDAMTRLKTLFSGLIDQLTVQLAPIIEAIAVSFTNLGVSGGGAASSINAAFTPTVRILSVIKGLLDNFLLGILTVQQGILKVAIAIEKTQLQIGFGGSEAAIKSFNRQLVSLQDTIIQIGGAESLSETIARLQRNARIVSTRQVDAAAGAPRGLRFPVEPKTPEQVASETQTRSQAQAFSAGFANSPIGKTIIEMLAEIKAQRQHTADIAAFARDPAPVTLQVGP